MAGPQFVSYDRWDAEHKALADRMRSAEIHLEALTGAEQIHEALEQRMKALEQAGRNHVAGERTRRDRVWLVLIAALSGVVFPLVAGTIVTFLHLRAG